MEDQGIPRICVHGLRTWIEVWKLITLPGKES